jgi:hypothetical protein
VSGKKDFIGMIREGIKTGLEVGLHNGRQQIIDMMCLALNDPEIMGKDTFGHDRIMKVIQGINEYIDTYQKAWEKDDETDYYRAKMDEALQKISPNTIDKFTDRYDYTPEYDYMKGRWKK